MFLDSSTINFIQPQVHINCTLFEERERERERERCTTTKALICMGFVDLQRNHYTQCQPEVAHPSGRSISVGTIEMKYYRLTNLDVLDSCKITILLI